MPEAMERALKREAAKRGYTGERKDRYIYGAMRKTGWKPKQEKQGGKRKMAAFGGGGP